MARFLRRRIMVEKSQISRFKEAARELGTDDREEVFDRALKRIAKAPPAKKADKPKKSKPAK